MAQKAADFVSHGITDIQHALGDLRNAINMAEKPDNKAQIQKAIDDISCACDHLSSYKD